MKRHWNQIQWIDRWMFYYYYFVWACVLCTLKREELSCRQLSIQVRNYVCSNNNQRQHQWINTKCALQNNLTHPMSKRSLPSFLAVSLSSLFSPPASTLPLVSHPEWIACENWTQDTRKTNKPITIHIHTHSPEHIWVYPPHIYSINRGGCFHFVCWSCIVWIRACLCYY